MAKEQEHESRSQHLFSKIGGRLLMNAKFAFALIALAALCTSAFSLESAGDWYSQAQTLYKSGSYQEAISAFDEGLKTDPQNASAWHHRGMALAGMGHGAEANQSIQKAMELIDQRLQENPEDQEALWLRAEEMDLFGKSEEALEAYGRVAELNSSHALEAWIRESDIQAALGRYNKSIESFSRAMTLVPANRSQSQIGFQRLRENNTILFTKAWLINGQIHRVSIGSYNVSTKSFDEIEQINSDYIAALQLKGKAVDPGRHGGSLMGSSLNWEMYTFNQPKAQPPTRPSLLTIAGVNLQGDEFIEVINGLKETVSFRNWSLEIQGSRISLPEHSLLPGKAVKAHLGSGQENGTDLFLDSSLELNDTAGSVSLRDGSEAKVASLDYWTKLDGSIAHQVTHYSGTAESDLEYSGTGDQGKMVQKAAGVGPFIAERTEIGPELAHNHSNKDELQENTADDWYKKGTELFENDSLEESVLAMERVIQLDPENSSAWLSIAITLGIMGNGSESSKAYEKALNLIDNDLKKNPQDARAWEAKSDALIGLGRQEESFDAIEKTLEILNLSIEKNPRDGEAWWSKANVLYRMGRSDEALQAYEKVIELNHTPRLADALLIKGYDFAIKGNYDEFKETFNQAIGLIPASDTAKLARTWNSAGFALAELGKEEEAFEAFEKYAQLSPGDRHSWRMKGDMASELGRYNVSIEAYDQALRIDPKWAEVWYKKGNALAKMDNHNDALKAFEKAVEISDEVIQKDAGNASGICIIKGYALIKLNRYDEAIEALDRALEIAPSSVPIFPAEAWNGKGDILLALGKNEDALEAYNKSIEFNPAFGRAWHGKGLAQSALGQFSEADLSFRVARKLGYQE